MNTLFDPIPLCSQIDPDEDDARLRQTIRLLTEFVNNGPYLQRDNNVCWFCFTGLGGEQDQRQAGHHPACSFLTAWLMVNYGEAIKPRSEELS